MTLRVTVLHPVTTLNRCLKGKPTPRPIKAILLLVWMCFYSIYEVKAAGSRSQEIWAVGQQPSIISCDLGQITESDLGESHR